ncbi:hypothetical protein ACSS6W_000098 [Trichoderma asperelloides]
MHIKELASGLKKALLPQKVCNLAHYDLCSDDDAGQFSSSLHMLHKVTERTFDTKANAYCAIKASFC